MEKRKDRRKHECTYTDLIVKISGRISPVLRELVESSVSDTNIYMEKAVDAAFDKDKIDAIASLVRSYVEGFNKAIGLMRTGTADVHPNNFYWFVNNYGSVVDAGISRRFFNTTFKSTAGIVSDNAILEMRAGDGCIDHLIDHYEAALGKGLRKPPKGFKITFKENEDYGPDPLSLRTNKYRNISLDLAL